MLKTTSFLMFCDMWNGLHSIWLFLPCQPLAPLPPQKVKCFSHFLISLYAISLLITHTFPKLQQWPVALEFAPEYSPYFQALSMTTSLLRLPWFGPVLQILKFKTLGSPDISSSLTHNIQKAKELPPFVTIWLSCSGFSMLEGPSEVRIPPTGWLNGI